MKKLLAVSFVLLASTLAFAHPEEVLKAVQENKDFKEVVEKLKNADAAKAWGGYVWGEMTIEEIASGSDMMSGTTTQTYLVKYPYTLEADWVNGRDTVVAVVSHVHRNGLRKPAVFTKVNKVYDSAEALK